VLFSRQIQSILYIVLFQALTKRLADSPLSTCGDTVLSWKGRSRDLGGGGGGHIVIETY